jgi:hydrogen peroxide-dependent heme synthase
VEPGLSPEIPAVPLTIEGASVLHQMFRFRWSALNALTPERRAEVAREAAARLAGMENREAGCQSAAYSMLGHKGDLMLVHFRESFEELNAAELQVARLGLSEYLEPAHSYLSVVELGLYQSTVKVYSGLAARNVEPHSEEWNREVNETLARQREAMRGRLFPEIPGARYVCFYPMDRKRGEAINFYTVPITDRQRMMDEHGTVGRRYAGEVKQIITGSIGFDDWEWGVTLWSDDPLSFKKLIYEMRFDEVSAVYALFGQFFVGIRLPAEKVPELIGS